MHLTHADTGAFPRRLDAEGKLQVRKYGAGLILTIHGAKRRRRQAKARKYEFGPQLIHGQRRRQHVAAGVGDARLGQNRLQGTVLTASAMERDEHPVEIRIPYCLKQATGDIPAESVNSGFLEGPGNRLSAFQRDFPLGGVASHKYGDTTQRRPGFGVYLECPVSCISHALSLHSLQVLLLRYRYRRRPESAE